MKKILIAICSISVLGILGYIAYKRFVHPTLSLDNWDVISKKGVFSFGPVQGNLSPNLETTLPGPYGWEIKGSVKEGLPSFELFKNGISKGNLSWEGVQL